ncbi:MAG: hypothetical protein Q7K54_05825 [Candidatus Parcubacteria bacterium]|nr:hypothetical protein [Candidatus Parcubacteria bacterium]
MIKVEDTRRQLDIVSLEYKYCFHCNQEIIGPVYLIAHNTKPSNITEAVTFLDNCRTYQRLVFHESCFEEIAGSDYMFDDDTQNTSPAAQK